MNIRTGVMSPKGIICQYVNRNRIMPLDYAMTTTMNLCSVFVMPFVCVVLLNVKQLLMLERHKYKNNQFNANRYGDIIDNNNNYSLPFCLYIYVNVYFLCSIFVLKFL